MKIIVICGHPNSGYEGVHQILTQAGLGLPKASRRELISSDDLHEKIFNSYGVDVKRLDSIAPIKMGKIWQYLAIDLFMGNMEQTNWGWANDKSTWLLDFWKDQDPHVSFILAYSPPEYVLGKALINRDITSAEIDLVLASWIAYQNEILRFYKQNSDRCLLVNAVATGQDPTNLVAKVNSTFSLELSQISESEAVFTNTSSIAETLSKALIDNDHAANILYRELETLADIADSRTSLLQVKYKQAFEEFIELLNEIDKAKIKISGDREYINKLEQKQIDLESEIQQLTQNNQERDQFNSNRKALIQKLMQARDEQNIPLLNGDEKTKLEMHLDDSVPVSSEKRNLIEQPDELEHYFTQWQELSNKE